MKELSLFIDGSVSTQTKVGYGAYLALSDPGHPLDQLEKQIKTRRFEQTSSTRLELQTLLWALNDLPTSEVKLLVYSDSQNLISLPARRPRLEQHDYRSKNNRRLNNYQLYQEFYRLTDQIECEFIKLRGHLASQQKGDLDRLFALVDKSARSALRKETSLESTP